MKRATPHSQGGFSAVELLVAIVVFGILVSMAWVAQARLLPHYRLAAATRQVVTDLRMARGKAIAQNTRFTVAFSSGGSSYSAERCTFGGGTWTCQPYALYKRGAAVDGSAQTIGLPSSVVSSTAITVVFDPRGSVTGGGAITLAIPGASVSRTVSINLSGLITVS